MIILILLNFSVVTLYGVPVVIESCTDDVFSTVIVALVLVLVL